MSENAELAAQMRALEGGLHGLYALVEQMITEGEEWVARGYTPMSLDLPSLMQWRYVMDHYRAALRKPEALSDPAARIRRQSEIMHWLAGSVRGDAREVLEMNLSWSPTWRSRGKAHWHALFKQAKTLLKSCGNDPGRLEAALLAEASAPNKGA